MLCLRGVSGNRDRLTFKKSTQYSKRKFNSREEWMIGQEIQGRFDSTVGPGCWEFCSDLWKGECHGPCGTVLFFCPALKLVRACA